MNSDQVDGIVQNELTRLNQRSGAIQTAYETQERIMRLNVSQASRMKKYAYLIILAAVTLVLVVLLILFQNSIPFYEVIIVVLLFLSILWGVYIYTGIQNRDPTDFDKLNANASNLVSQAELDLLMNGQGSDGKGGSTCIEESCCSTNGTKWDYQTKKCIPTKKSGFTTLYDSYGDLDNKKISDYSAYEFSLYSPYQK
jgi:hypothetical protein